MATSFMPLPFPIGMPGPPPGLFGKTIYKYHTSDGSCPNNGAPPSAAASAPAGPPPPYAPPMPNFWPGMVPPQPPPAPMFMQSGAGGPMVCIPNPPGPPPAPVYVPPQYPGPKPKPPPNPPRNHGPTFLAGSPDQPVTGNRVKGQIAKFPNSGAGYIFPKDNAVFHIFNDNILNKYQQDRFGRFFMSPPSTEDFKATFAPTLMPISEFMEQIDCIKRAPHNWPRYDIGIAEILDLGDGWFQKGTVIHIDDPKARCKIGDIWDGNVGEAGKGRPVYLVRVP